MQHRRQQWQGLSWEGARLADKLEAEALSERQLSEMAGPRRLSNWEGHPTGSMMWEASKERKASDEKKLDMASARDNKLS